MKAFGFSDIPSAKRRPDKESDDRQRQDAALRPRFVSATLRDHLRHPAELKPKPILAPHMRKGSFVLVHSDPKLDPSSLAPEIARLGASEGNDAVHCSSSDGIYAHLGLVSSGPYKVLLVAPDMPYHALIEPIDAILDTGIPTDVAGRIRRLCPDAIAAPEFVADRQAVVDKALGWSDDLIVVDLTHTLTITDAHPFSPRSLLQRFAGLLPTHRPAVAFVIDTEQLWASWPTVWMPCDRVLRAELAVGPDSTGSPQMVLVRERLSVCTGAAASKGNARTARPAAGDTSAAPKQRRPTQAEIDEMVEEVNQGRKQADVAREKGFHKSTISRHVKKARNPQTLDGTFRRVSDTDDKTSKPGAA